MNDTLLDSYGYVSDISVSESSGLCDAENGTFYILTCNDLATLIFDIVIPREKLHIRFGALDGVRAAGGRQPGCHVQLHL